MSEAIEAKEREYIRWILGAQSFAKGEQPQRETLYFLEDGAKLAATAISEQQLMEDIQAKLVLGGVPQNVKVDILNLMQDHLGRTRDARSKTGEIFEKLRTILANRA